MRTNFFRTSASVIFATAAALIATTDTAASASSPVASMSFASAVSLSTGAFAVVPMGHLNDPSDTFWELFHRSPSSAKWSLVTPAGTADNGGLAVGASQTSVLAGVMTSEDLAFSTTALSNNAGKTWSPGILPAPLVGVPDALVVGTGGRSAALVTSQHGELLVKSTGGSSWRTSISTAQLAKSIAGRACGIRVLRAVTLSSNGVLMVGATCEEPGIVGVLEQVGSAWNLAEIVLPSSLRTATISVLRLVSLGSETSALLSASSNGKTSLLVAELSSSRSVWAVSPVLPVATSTNPLATGAFLKGEFFVEEADSAGARFELFVPAAHGWRAIPNVPQQTRTISVRPNGQIHALTTTGSSLSDYVLTAKGTSWQRTQILSVPIQYGSSD